MAVSAANSAVSSVIRRCDDHPAVRIVTLGAGGDALHGGQRVVDDLAIGGRHRLEHPGHTRGLDLVGHLHGELAECRTATLAVATDIHPQAGVVVAEAALRGHTGQILHGLERGPTGADEQTELLAVHSHLQIVTVLHQFHRAGETERPDQGLHESLRFLADLPCVHQLLLGFAVIRRSGVVLRRCGRLRGTGLTLTQRPDWQFDPALGQRKLLEQLQAASLMTWSAEALAQAHAAAGALLQFAEHTQGRALSHVQSLLVQRDDTLIDLPPATRRNLELTRTLRGEESPTLFSLMDTCMSGMGSRLLKRWLQEPPRDRSVAQARLDAIAALQGTAQGAGPWQRLREQLKGISDVERITARIALRQVRPRELVGLQLTLQKAELLAQAVPGQATLFS